MQVQHLSAYDVAPETIAALRAAIGDTLLPVQELCVREGLLRSLPEGRGQSLLVAAPTSSGKTFIGELAAVHAAQTGLRVLYLVPLKAMAEEAYRTLGARYQALDLKVVISTRDHRDFDEAIESGEFHIAVLVYEKLQSLLVTRPEILGKVGLVVVDELQMLGDQGRGPHLELLLTKIRRAQRAAEDGVGPQLVCLSAPMSGLEDLAQWLGAHVVLDERRPVELRSGVLHRGRFLYRSSRAGTPASLEPASGDDDTQRFEEEIYADPGERDGRDCRRQLRRVVAALCARGESTLVFVPDKARCLEAARDLCGALAELDRPVPPAGWALDEIASTDEGQARDELQQTLRRGVAFHNSDLTQGQREIVERAFRRGEVRVLVATSTLAMGVNLPARNVVLAERWKWRYSRRYNKWVRDDLTKAEYDGMSGRAGRLGLEGAITGFGRSMLVAPSRFDAEVWLRTLVSAPPAEIEPTLLGKPLGDVVLDVVAAGLCRSEEEIIDFLLSTYTGYVRWSRRPGREAFTQSIVQTVEELLRNDLLARDEGGSLEITAVGRVCARKGLMVRSGVLMARWADAASPVSVKITPLEVLLVCALTPDGGEAHVPLSLPEHRFGDYWTRMLLKAQELGVAERPVFRWLRDQRGRLTYEQTKSVKKALLLLDWVDCQEGAQLERDHSVWAGAVAHAAADFAWLVDALCEMCDARGWPSERAAGLQVLSERLRLGVTEALLPLARAAGGALSRGHLLAAAKASAGQGLGVEQALPALIEAGPAAVTQALSGANRSLLQKIFQIQAARAALGRTQQRAGNGAAPGSGPGNGNGHTGAQRQAATSGLGAAVATQATVLQMPLAAEAQARVQAQAQAIVAAAAEVDLAAVEVGEPGAGARLSTMRPEPAPATADLPLDQVTVTGRPVAPRQQQADLPREREVAPALPALRPVIVRPKPAADLELVLLSDAEPRRCYVGLGERRVALSPGSFAMLVRLALGAAEDMGWVRLQDLGGSASGVRKGVSRLRLELRQVSAEARSWVENDGHGNYRLSHSAPKVVLDKEALRRHPLEIVRAVLKAA
jgi:helicase